ncbi:hypothetical protein JANAI62_35510 [Jannaschia pagri]|uniref:Type I restriction enzyme R protein N terminus (HSDR_N) n=1 Tax=Jannaschia pagri TaxID=2829797 RepID=A0ABQ4NR96_9RHOB|nr:MULTISPECIES: hypothetical protein [unclassified Jannaschia]GIT93165.1 hypothetical protein JANAI61_36230 [Jannaschia sp. AI_61]GIT96928.1 hypothetical protein JANAI62_35510 [Jannaschia sp. AI_62]
MTLDIRGSLKNTKPSRNRYVVFEELLSNALDSYLVRKTASGNIEPFEAKFEIALQSLNLFGDDFSACIRCSDNGAGMGKEQMAAFVTKDTSYKDDLAVPGIGKCKGTGRIQFFLHYEQVSIESVFEEEGRQYKVTAEYNAPRKLFSLEDFDVAATEGQSIGTTITLDRLRPEIKEPVYDTSDISQFFSADILRSHLFGAFVHRLVGLSETLGEFKIAIRSDIAGATEERAIIQSDLPNPDNIYPLKVFVKDPDTGEDTEDFRDISVAHYTLPVTEFDLKKNMIALCAKQTPVLEVTGKFLRTRAIESAPVNGNYHILLIEGAVFDDNVNENRDGFLGIPETPDSSGFLDTEKVSFDDVYKTIEPLVVRLLSPPTWTREQVVEEMASDFGLSEEMITDTVTRIQFGETAKDVAVRVLEKHQKKVIDTTEEILTMKSEILHLDPATPEFRDRVNDLAWKVTSAIDEIDKTNLSQLVVRRSAIIDILAHAKDLELTAQASESGARRRDESILHNIFFPRFTDSTETKDHDVWLLSEEYQYFDYITSDKQLSSMRLEGQVPLFDADVDEVLEAAFESTNSQFGGKRPDIALFTKEGAAVIVEFKAPGVGMQEHQNDLVEYANILCAKSNGQINRFYGYLVGNTIEPMRVFGWERFAKGGGYFRTADLKEPNTGHTIGQLYSEMLKYDDIVDRARTRIRAYRERLGLRSA